MPEALLVEPCRVPHVNWRRQVDPPTVHWQVDPPTVRRHHARCCLLWVTPTPMGPPPGACPLAVDDSASVLICGWFVSSPLSQWPTLSILRKSMTWGCIIWCNVSRRSPVLCFFSVLLDLFDRLSQSYARAARFLQPLPVDYCITAALQKRFGSVLLSGAVAA